MFVLAKGKPIVAKILVDRPDVTAGAGTRCYGSGRMRDDAMPDAWVRVEVRAGFGRRGPIWRYATGGGDAAIQGILRFSFKVCPGIAS